MTFHYALYLNICMLCCIYLYFLLFSKSWMLVELFYIHIPRVSIEHLLIYCKERISKIRGWDSFSPHFYSGCEFRLISKKQSGSSLPILNDLFGTPTPQNHEFIYLKILMQENGSYKRKGYPSIWFLYFFPNYALYSIGN